MSVCASGFKAPSYLIYLRFNLNIVFHFINEHVWSSAHERKAAFTINAAMNREAKHLLMTLMEFNAPEPHFCIRVV